MGETISGISVLLGSAVVSTIITAIFNQYNNRKNNSLKYITKERKAWREKIRSIAEKMQMCEFRGKGKKDIEKYLVELELNINSYGRGNIGSDKEDAYIWNEIDEIREVDNEEYFKRHKELLIYYISLMLKEDWDRSKNEVIGFSQMFVEVLSIILINLGLAYFYLYIGKYAFTTYIVTLVKVVIYTVAIYAVFKVIQALADMFSIQLRKNIYLLFWYKLTIVLLLIFCIDALIIVYSFILLNKEFPNEKLMNLITVMVYYLESVKIFWNWFTRNLRKLTLSQQLIYNRERILKENEMKIVKYGEEMGEVYQYIRDNQDDIIKVKKSVSSLKNLLDEYESEVKKCLRKKSKEIMTQNVRNKICELENNLQVIRKYRENINQYYNIGLINKIPYIKQLFANFWNRIITIIVKIKDFIYKERGKLE